jgi:DNA-binding CsgD family transcriptional regulator
MEKGTGRTETLLQMILLQLMKDTNQGEKIKKLSLAGLSNVEIADVLDTTPAVVATTLYASRKKPQRTRSSRKKR